MPGKYLEYVKAGKYVVPVEIQFISTTYTELATDRQITTSKWVDRRHWREIKAMLKPAIELTTKYNEAGTEKISKSHHISFGQEIALGYIIHLNKDKSPFLAILDSKKNCWTDDEDEPEFDENTNLADFGGRHKNYTPTKCFIKVCVLKKTGSLTEDSKKLRKELGVKTDDVRNYFQPSSQSSGDSQIPGPSTLSSNFNDKGRNSVMSLALPETYRDSMRRSSSPSDVSGSGTESLIDIPPPVSFDRGIISYTDNQLVLRRSPENFRSRTSLLLAATDSSLIMTRTVGSDDGSECGIRIRKRSWDDDDIEEDDDDLPELPDIEEDISLIAHSKTKRGKRVAKPRKKSFTERSPHKHANESGLPDIDENFSRSGRSGKPKKKRTVAIVEPMKPSNAAMSFEEAIGAYALSTVERKKKTRISSPTIDRLPNSASRVKNSAIEILPDDSELFSTDASGVQRITILDSKRKKKTVLEKPPRKRRKKKSVGVMMFDRSIFTESPETSKNKGDDAITSEESEPEMPVLVKMVGTSDDDNTQSERDESFESTELLESRVNVPSLERQEHDGIEASLPDNEERPLNSPIRVPLSPSKESSSKLKSTTEESSPKSSLRTKKKLLKKRKKVRIFQPTDYEESSSASVTGNTSKNSLSPEDDKVQETSTIPRRVRFASDSDDITCETAYQKTPIRKRKRRKVSKVVISEPVNPSSADEAMQASILKDTCDTLLSLAGNVGRSSGDAETQTLLTGAPGPSCELDALGISEPDINEEFVPIPITKTEKGEQPELHYNSDYANGAFSEGDDDDILFAGQFQANLHLPALGSPEGAMDDLELFSFDNSDGVCEETVSTMYPTIVGNIEEVGSQLASEGNTSQEDFNQDDIIDYTFGIREDEDQIACSSGGAYANFAKKTEANQSPRTPRQEIPQSEHDYPGSSLENMSMYELINNPQTLQGGMGLCNKLTSKRINVKEFNKRLGLSGSDSSKRDSNKDKELMPPPPKKRAVSPDICALNPEITAKQLRKQKKDQEQQASSSTAGSSQPQSRFDDDSATDDENGRGGEDFFRELMSRIDKNETEDQYEPQGDEFDLSQRSHCMLGMFNRYSEKSRLYKIHSKKIVELTIPELQEHFERLKPLIEGISEDRVESERHLLYWSRNQHDKQHLRSLNFGPQPFTSRHEKALSAYLYDFVLPQPCSRLKYTDYINYVMLPEAFIRIYASVNEISYVLAEKELRFGPCYEGPVGE